MAHPRHRILTASPLLLDTGSTNPGSRMAHRNAAFLALSFMAVNGNIQTKKTFDYEVDPRRFELVVECRDAADLAVARATLVINILDKEEPPECLNEAFVKGTAVKSIDENHPMLVPVYSVEARDPDEGNLLTYSLVSESSAPTPDGNFFSVDPTNGVVSRTSANPLDFDEGYHTCQLKIQVKDRSDLSCEGMVTIEIQDLNDEPPEFVKYPGDTIEVSESAIVGTMITTVQATDKDAGSKVTYSFAVPQEMFTLDPDLGALTLRKKLDFDNPANPKTYPLLMKATDNDAMHTSFYTLSIVVLNENEPPACDPGFSAGVSLIVMETLPANAVVYRILASDPDEGEDIKFEVLDWMEGTDIYFYLNEDSGVISTTAVPLDYEKDPKIFAMVVSATDKTADPKSCTGTLTFNIMNDNDEAPIFINVPANRITFPENRPAGTVLYDLRATDRDVDDGVHYEFIKPYRGLSINEDTGDITLAFPLDYEDQSIPPMRTVTVRAYDNDRVHSSTAQITFSLLDLNDNPPRCEDDVMVVTFAETTPIGTSLLRLKCTDDDILAPNNVLQYSMELDDHSTNKFTLEGDEVTLGPNGLDYDSLTFSGMQFTHILIIRVSDRGEPPLTSIVTVFVRVTRVNEFEPEPRENVFTVAENSVLGTLVGTVRFTDRDWPFNNLKYTVVGDDFGSPPRFYIEPDTGIIKVLNALDREEKAQYTARIQATDLNNDKEPDPLRQLSRIAVVTINIQNVNDEPPVCDPEHYKALIYSTDKAPFLRLRCSDKDSPNDQLGYAITGGNGVNRFTLQRAGDDPPFLATSQNFQYHVFEGIQDPTVFQLLIQVTDEVGGNPAARLTSTATVIVEVIPWTTTVATKPTTTTTTSVTTSVLVKLAYVWNPDTWFPAILALTGVLLLLCLYAVSWGLLKESPKYGRFFPQCHGCKKKPPNDPFQNKNTGLREAEPIERPLKPSEKSTVLPGNPFPSTIYDGRAVDIATGKHYLFNSKTGESQWLNHT
ncbi:cadherin-related family member 4-like isoform X2 [Ambystoma mexicanum]|uniref:cadherin-related family member 4-like isoform X2 n=1 Tax=Ambystoma mexicanum TaxID=8296 RepID=UPI0037E8D1C5